MAADRNDPTLKVFLHSLSGVRDRIEQIILFGSRVRGDEKPYSDYDVLIVVRERERDLMDTVHDAVMDALLATGRLSVSKSVPPTRFRSILEDPNPVF